MERTKSAELDGYYFDCRQHPTQRKRKYGCLSGISKAGNPWFTLKKEVRLETLSLKHSQIHIPSLIGPFGSNLRSVKLAGSHNFPQLAVMLQQKLEQITRLDVNFSGDAAKQAELMDCIAQMKGLKSFNEQSSDNFASAV